jgi:2-haloacid dehalogenase
VFETPALACKTAQTFSSFLAVAKAAMLAPRGSIMNSHVSGSVLAFDVYGTLIDPFHMEEHLRAAFGDRAKEASELWRGKQLEYSWRRALMKKYQDFNRCTEQALRFVCAQLGTPLAEDTLQELMIQYLKLPAYADVPAALESLAAQGFKMVAFSNGTESAVRGLLEHAGVLDRFSGIVSVDILRTFKPDPAVYEFLATQADAPKEKVWVISSNPFDVIGAKACGLRAVWVQRDLKRAFDPWEYQPDVVVNGLGELNDKLRIS